MKFKGILVVLCLFVLMIGHQAVGQEQPDPLAIRGVFADALDNQDVEGIVSAFTDDGVFDFVVQPVPLLEGKEMIRAFFADHFAGNPDSHTTEGLALTDGNIVVVNHDIVGTNTGESSLPATGNPWVMPHVDIYEFEGDKIKRLTTYTDYTGVLIQLGYAPAPAMPELVPSFTLPDPEPTGLAPLAAAVESFARWNSRDLAHDAKMFHPDAEFFLAPAGVPLTKEAYTAMNELYLGAFGDRQAEVLRMVDLGDGWVLSEVVFVGTHTGEYFGVPASGYPFSLRGAVLQRFDADGLLTNHNAYYDNLILMDQITTAPWPLDGIWVSTVPTPMGNLTLTTMYVAQDAAKTRYSGSLDEINQMPLLADIYPEAEPISQWAGGQANMIGRNKYEATYLGYSRKTVETELGMMNEIVGLFTIKANFELLDPDTLQGHGTGSYYLAEQDADRNGFPDEGQEPVACIPWGWTGKRLTQLPGCTPPPMPGQ